MVQAHQMGYARAENRQTAAAYGLDDTARLLNALTSAAKPYELLLFPDERHMPRGLKDRTYMEQRIFAFLADALK